MSQSPCDSTIKGQGLPFSGSETTACQGQLEFSRPGQLTPLNQIHKRLMNKPGNSFTLLTLTVSRTGARPLVKRLSREQGPRKVGSRWPQSPESEPEP